MKKIPTIFVRNPERLSEVLPEWHPACLWVRDGEGMATIKLDGTCCLIENDKFYKRREVKAGATVPAGFTETDRDETTGKLVGWMPVDDSPNDRWHREGLTALRGALGHAPDGTYELMGPKVQGNTLGLTDHHMLIEHGSDFVVGSIKDDQPPRDFVGIQAWLEDHPDLEGVVWHHPDGRMAKIKRRDFDLAWPPA